MSIPLQVTFHNADHSDAVEALVREKAEKLDRFREQITGCRVVIEAPHRSQTKGNLYKVTIDLHVPGKDILVDRSPKEHHAHEDVYTAVRDAFDHAVRELEKVQYKRREQHRRSDT